MLKTCEDSRGQVPEKALPVFLLGTCDGVVTTDGITQFCCLQVPVINYLSRLEMRVSMPSTPNWSEGMISGMADVDGLLQKTTLNWHLVTTIF